MYDEIFERLSASAFRSGFRLNAKDRDYLIRNGFDAIRSHAEDFVSRRIAPAEIPNDGRQTPTKGHPVFTAQHATATCCRGCISKWHGFEKGVALTSGRREYVVGLIMEWLKRNRDV